MQNVLGTKLPFKKHPNSMKVLPFHTLVWQSGLFALHPLTHLHNYWSEVRPRATLRDVCPLHVCVGVVVGLNLTGRCKHRLGRSAR